MQLMIVNLDITCHMGIILKLPLLLLLLILGTPETLTFPLNVLYRTRTILMRYPTPTDCTTYGNPISFSFFLGSFLQFLESQWLSRIELDSSYLMRYPTITQHITQGIPYHEDNRPRHNIQLMIVNLDITYHMGTTPSYSLS